MRLALEDLSAFELTVLRALVAAVIFLPFVRLASLRDSDTPMPDLVRFFILGASGIVTYQLALNLAAESATATVVAILATLAPMLTAVLAWYVLRERIPGKAVLGSVIAFLGATLVIIGPSGDALGKTELGGAAIALIPPVSWAIYTVVAKPLFERFSWSEVAINSTVAGGLLLLPWSIGPVASLPNLPPDIIWTVAYLAVISTNLAYLGWNRALSGLETHQAAGWIYAVPLITAITAIPLVGEGLTYSLVLGGLLIVAGVILVERRARG